MKLVGYTELVHQLPPKMDGEGAGELAPIRVNGVHPGVIGDSPCWAAKPEGVLDPIAERTRVGRLVTMRELSEAAPLPARERRRQRRQSGRRRRLDPEITPPPG